ncbi:MAG: hypothetical protein HQL05_05535 [Nitrospirae bacterium]|uniref:Uncharacterized protein n=2 Tax=Nitrospirota TaxID=40117 RepID=A0A142BTZ4_9BACT|nr:hypothetical protein [Candidatus Magnetobacterium casensis]AIM41342.1 hypothetical protein Mcas_0747 [Candidatus Magnetobacterium casensis]AMP41582.1 hypothetical protein [uncultured Nitrospirota bacterium]MBF0337275.1 hypothetical protein [Nitrospirota bacterium]
MVSEFSAIQEYECLKSDREEFFQMLDEIRQQVKGVDPQELDRAIEEAVMEAKKAELTTVSA